MFWHDVHCHCVKLAGRHKRYTDGIKQRKQHKQADDQVHGNQRCFLKHFLSFCFCIHCQMQCLQLLCRISFWSGNRSCYRRHQYFTPLFSMWNITRVSAMTIRNKTTDCAAALPNR